MNTGQNNESLCDVRTYVTFSHGIFPLYQTLFTLLVFELLHIFLSCRPLHPCRLYVLWGFVVVTTSVTKAAKRKVSH